jgi:hypothetical protein
MPKMGATLFATDLCTFHTVTVVGILQNVFRLDWLPITRPTGTRIEFGGGFKKSIFATCTQINSRVVTIPVFARKCRLGAALTANPILLFS